MPQIQILPAVPSFGERLGETLGRIGGTFAAMPLAKYLQQKEQQKDVDLIRNLPPNASDLDYLAAAAKLSPPGAKTVAPLIQQVIKKEQGMAQAQNGQQVAQASLNRIGEMLKEDLLGFNYHKLTTEKGRAAKGELNSIRAGLEAALLPLVNKGTLAKERFNFIMSLIPQYGDTQATVYGKLKGLSTALNLDFSQLEESLGSRFEAQKATPKEIPGGKPKIKSFRDEKGQIYDIPLEEVETVLKAHPHLKEAK